MLVPPDPTRVLTLITRMNIGGPARHVLELARNLPPDVDLTLAAGRPPDVEGELTAAGTPVHHLPLVREVSPSSDVAAFNAARRLIHEVRPHIVHTHMAKAGAIGRAAASTVGSDIRTVHTFHGHVLAGYFAAPAERAFLYAERLLARRTDVLVAVSAEIRDALLDLGVGRASQYEVVPLGLDLGAFADAQRGQLRGAIGIGPEVPLAGVVARLVPIKDHATLVRAVAAVPQLHLAVIGDGECRAELDALRTELGVQDRIHFTGWWLDMPTALVDLDMAVLTSRNEGTPLALMEAAASGLPIVATDVGGVASLVEDGGNGFLVPPGDVAAVADRLRRLIDDAALARAMAERSRRFAAELAARNDPARQLAELYRSLRRP